MAAEARNRAWGVDRALCDALVDRYLEWWEAAGLVRGAYQRWVDAGARDPDAFYRYNAALDQEQLAAKRYQEMAGRADPAAIAGYPRAVADRGEGGP